jgi:hypothetical protein
VAKSTKSTRQMRQVSRACAIGLTITPKLSEIHGIPLEGALAVWHDDKWWTPGALRAANICLDMNGIMGMFGERNKVWKVRVWTPAETIHILNDLSASAPPVG